MNIGYSIGIFFNEIVIKIQGFFIQENALKNVVCKMVTTLSRPLFIK